MCEMRQVYVSDGRRWRRETEKKDGGNRMAMAFLKGTLANNPNMVKEVGTGITHKSYLITFA